MLQRMQKFWVHDCCLLDFFCFQNCNHQMVQKTEVFKIKTSHEVFSSITMVTVPEEWQSQKYEIQQ